MMVKFVSIKASLGVRFPAGIPAFSPGRRPAWKLHPGLILPLFGSSFVGAAYPDPCDFPGAVPPHLEGPGEASSSVVASESTTATAAPLSRRCHPASVQAPPPLRSV